MLENIGLIASLLNTSINLEDTQDMLFPERKFNKLLSKEELEALPQKDFINYLRENLWDRYAKEKYQKPFDELSWEDKRDVDFTAVLEILKATDQVRNEDTDENRSNL